jgi:hypothetical protein
MAGRYTGSYLERLNGWRAVTILADIAQFKPAKRQQLDVRLWQADIESDADHRAIEGPRRRPRRIAVATQACLNRCRSYK